MIPYFSRETKEAALEAYNHHCVLCDALATGCHHRLHNTKANRRRFPLFIQSIFNCAPLCFNCHEKRKHELNIPLKVADAYEWAMRKLKEG